MKRKNYHNICYSAPSVKVGAIIIMLTLTSLGILFSPMESSGQVVFVPTHHYRSAAASSLAPVPSSSINTPHSDTSASSSSSSSTNAGGDITTSEANNNNKLIIINFDDGWKSQFIYAKPILDQYGFKASFFIVCNYVNSGLLTRMNWQDIAELQKDGMDIESHTMSHAALDKLPIDALNYQIGGSKQCLADHGINATIFAYPFNLGSNMPSVVNIVANYYDFARTGSSPLMFLNCNGFHNKNGEPIQNDCRTYLPDGTLTFANRYDIRSDSFNHIDNNNNYDPSQMFQQFVKRVNSQIPYNTQNGKINAIPIITYHQLTYDISQYNLEGTTITVDLFAAQMKYLHDNGFKVITLKDLGYDTNNNVFYIKNLNA